MVRQTEGHFETGRREFERRDVEIEANVSEGMGKKREHRKWQMGKSSKEGLER